MLLPQRDGCHLWNMQIASDAWLIALYIILRANSSTAQVLALLGNYLIEKVILSGIYATLLRQTRRESEMHTNESYNKDDFEQRDLQCVDVNAWFKAQMLHLWRTDSNCLKQTCQCELFMSTRTCIEIIFSFASKYCKIMLHVSFKPNCARLYVACFPNLIF